VNRPKTDTVKGIDIDIADILNHNYGCRIDIGKGDTDSCLVCPIVCYVRFISLIVMGEYSVYPRQCFSYFGGDRLRSPAREAANVP